MSTDLVGPLPVIRFADGSRQAYTPPRNTCDIRYATCKDHHPACDCREALHAEDVNEYRAMLREVEQAIIAATADHNVWAYDRHGQEDPFSACKCPLCAIRRECFVGYGDFATARLDATRRQEAERARISHTETDPQDVVDAEIDEVPF